MTKRQRGVGVRRSNDYYLCSSFLRFPCLIMIMDSPLLRLGTVVLVLLAALAPIWAQRTETKWELKVSDDFNFCETWRFGVETHNVRDWKTIPLKCQEFVKEYMMGSQYAMDSALVANESIVYVNSLQLSSDGTDAWVFDVDETLLSNLPYYQDHEFGAEDFDENSWNGWVYQEEAPALSASHRLYTHLIKLGVKVFFLTGRGEEQRNATARNLIQAGYHSWEQLLLRGPDDNGKTAVLYKSERRSQIEQVGFKIRGNSGDQWSDLSGISTGDRTFKLPNPMYYIA
uniref:TSA: Wollemia nobilis Ref_Wollemi_Transcript_13276_1116 transcribed RNA sequence n=1 Tax=Wollemia nobilis TaxID=56998 RepID=A0A0C9RTX9_9CONI